MGKSDGGAATSNNVYIMDKKYAWVPARMVENLGDKAIVSVPMYNEEAEILSDGGKGAVSWKEDKVSLKHYPGKSLPLQNVDKSGMLTMVPDMVDLPYLHEAAILYNLKARHVQALPYTRTGDIVIAVNPYQWLTHLYTEEQQIEYAKKLVWECGDMDRRKEVEPHVYETSALCYKGLSVEDVSQSILVSGESGAGKTETVKICMNHMASLQKDPNEPETENKVVQRVVDSNPLLEIFGNAKTRRNDNSSRFGKYIMLQFLRKEKVGQSMAHCELVGSKCNVYLLEKSRITTHDESERTYHVFYALVGAKDEDKVKIWSGLKGTKNTSFKYVGHTDTTSWDKKSDGDHFYSTREGLANVGVGGEKFTTLMRAIATVLQIGQLTFGPVAGDEEKSEVTSAKELEGLSEVIGIAPPELALAITERTMKTRGEVFKVPLKPDAAKDNADAFAREIYSKLFLWLVREINFATCAEENYTGGQSVEFKTIGLLDIFGFESFPVNGFEQLCINYANEKLQQKFTRDIFSTVQDEYKFEGIALDDITYDDNSDVLDLIEGRTGLLAMLNEECVRPKGSDKEFVYKAINQNKKSACLIADRLLGPLDFGIHHYAGKVVYFAEGFIARNQDSMAEDLIQIAKTSSNDIIANHLQNDKMMHNEVEPVRAAPRRGKSNIASDTLWNKFKSQLNSLMKSLNETQSRYIRCVKPNTIKKPLILMHMTSIEQLRCAGVVAAVTISRSAFPNRLDHRTCYERFKVLKQKKGAKATTDKIDHKVEIVKILDHALDKLKDGDKKAYVIGKSRVYFRMGALEFLEGERSKGFDVWVIDIQKVVRGFLDRQRVKEMNKPEPEPEPEPEEPEVQVASTASSSSAKETSKDDLKVLPIQCAWRCYAARKEAKRRKKDKKGKKKKQKKQNKAAARIQAIARGFLTKRKVADLIKQKREKDALTNKIKQLEDQVKEAEKQRAEEVEKAREVAESEMADYRKKVKEEMANDKEKKKKNAQQQSLIEESGKIIEYLRKENMKLRNQNDTMRKDFKSLKENNQRLMEANASAGQSFTALNDHAKQLNATNAKLIKNVESYKGQLEKLKDDLKTRQTYYLAEAEARLAYQKTMAQIVGAVQEKCRDAQLVEDVVIMALECEAEAKSERAALEAAAKKSKAASASKSAPSKQKSKSKRSSAPSVAKTEVSDSDSSGSDSD